MVFGAKLAAAACSFLAMVLAARLLGPAEFGDLAILRTLTALLAGLAGPAFDAALVRFASGKSDAAAAHYARAAGRVKAWMAAACILAGLILGAPLAATLLDASASPSTGLLVFAAFAGAAILLGLDFARAWYQSRERFAAYAGLEALAGLLRFGGVVLLVLAGMRSLGLVLAALLLLPLLPAALGLGGIRGIWSGAPQDADARSRTRAETIAFAKWVVVACVLTSAAQNVDMLLLGAFDAGAEAVGDYGAARQLMLVGDLLVATLFSVLLPRASARASEGAAGAALLRWTGWTILAALLAVPMLLPAPWIASLVFGADYDGAGPLFAVLLAGTLLSLAFAPAGATIYGLGHSRMVAALEGVKLAATLGAALLLVPRHGAMGMAAAVASAKGAGAVLTFLAALRFSRPGA
jgi:O-antigen/teichoic acid export membrane protein